jgi:hypothetical protein
MSASPATAWAKRTLVQAGEPELHEALTVRAKRKLNGDGTVSVGGATWESDAGWLAGRWRSRRAACATRACRTIDAAS